LIQREIDAADTEELAELKFGLVDKESHLLRISSSAPRMRTVVMVMSSDVNHGIPSHLLEDVAPTNYRSGCSLIQREIDAADTEELAELKFGLVDKESRHRGCEQS
jgi:hypothetical protein